MEKRTVYPFFFFLFLLTMPGRINAVDYEIAVVTRVHGMVTTRYGVEGKPVFTTPGALLFNRAILNTTKNGMVQIRFIKGGSTVFIPSESEVLLMLEGESETARVNKGQAIFDAQAPHRGSVDIGTPATIMTTPTSSVSLVTHEVSSENSALFLISGNSMITDPEFSEWIALNSPSAAYVSAGSPLLHRSALTPGDNTRLDKFVKTARSMKILEPLTHTLVFRSDTGGSVAPGDTMTALQGYAIEIVANAEPGYVFVCWELLHGAAVIANPVEYSTTVSVSTDACIRARFTNVPTTLSVNVQGEGKTVPEGDAFIPRNKPWKISAHPFYGYALKQWVVSDGVKVINSDSSSATVIIENYAGSVTAEFDHRIFTCSLSTTEGGAVTPDSNLQVAHGDSVIIKAIPDKNYLFIKWEVISGFPHIENPYAAITSIQCDSGNAAVRARFHRRNNTAQVTIQKHECAAISPCGMISVPCGEAFSITTTPKNGYQLNKWFVRLGNATIINGEKTTVHANTDCEILPEIVTKTFNLTVNTHGPGTSSPSGMTKVFYNTHHTITATPEKGKRFACWEVKGGDAIITDKYKPVTTVKLSTTDAVIAAEFAAVICTLIVDATVGGYIEPADTQIIYKGKATAIKAVPNPRAAFLGWSVETGKECIEFSDTVTVREQILTLKENGFVKIKAAFTTKTVELTVLNNGLGLTEPEKSIWVPQNQWIPLRAVPAEGNKFLHWVNIAGSRYEIHDQFSAETEINPGTQDARVKAIFDTGSGYIPPDFQAIPSKGPYQLTIITDKSMGEVTPGGPLIVKKGVPVTLSARPFSKYRFHEWIVQDGNAIISDHYSTKTSVILANGNASVEARFIPETTHILKVQFFGPKSEKRTVVIPYR